MTIVHKRILYLIFFALFFISAPIVLMYAQGYKLDWHGRKMVKTGVIFLETKPSKAQIYLDNKLYTENTTARIQRLLPGEYDIKLVKAGYRPWQKKLTIYPNSTTYAQYIRLFKQTPQVNQLLEGQVIYAKYSPHESLIALITTQEEILYLNIYNISTGQSVDKVLLARQDYFVRGIKWNQNSDKLIVELSQDSAHQKVAQADEKIWLLYEMDLREQVKNLNFAIKQDPETVNFYEFNQSLFYYYIESKTGLGEFRKYNQLIEDDNLVTQAELDDFYFDGNNIYYVNVTENASGIYYFSLAEPEDKYLINNLLPADDYKIIDIHNDLITIHSASQDKLYLIKLNSAGEAEETNMIANAAGVRWHKNKQLIAWWNDYELWIWEVENNDAKKELLTRVSTVIDNVFWYPVETHLAYSTFNKIRIIELIAHSGVRETTDIFTAQELDSPILNRKGDVVYFTGKVGKDEGLFELAIQ